jgi:hypothetical protein
MIPFLAPLLGSLAGSLLPASVGTSIAGAVGASGAMGGLIASAAPKALGAGIGTLVAGGDIGEAAANAVGFGLGGAAAQQGLAAIFPNLGAGAGAAEAAAGAGGPAQMDPRMAMQAMQMMGGGQEAQGPSAAPLESIRPQPRPDDMGQSAMNTMGAAPPQPAGLPQTPTTTVPSMYQTPGQPQMGLASLPGMGGAPMPSVEQMISSLGPNAPAAQQYLRGFA